MSKKNRVIIAGLIVLVVVLTLVILYLLMFTNNPTQEDPNTSNAPNTNQQENNEQEDLKLAEFGNDMVLTTNNKTKIRVVNDYDEAFFTKNKNLLIMFASWCPNCQQEIAEIEKILQHYESDKNVNVVVIAHEYNDTVTDLINLLENDVNFGNIEVLLDLKRIIRKTIDPEASTIPISYVVDKKGNILKKHSESITLGIAKDMVKE